MANSSPEWEEQAFPSCSWSTSSYWAALIWVISMTECIHECTHTHTLAPKLMSVTECPQTTLTLTLMSAIPGNPRLVLMSASVWVDPSKKFSAAPPRLSTLPTRTHECECLHSACTQLDHQGPMPYPMTHSLVRVLERRARLGSRHLYFSESSYLARMG